MGGRCPFFGGKGGMKMLVGDMLMAAARAFPRKPAVIFRDEVLTYNQFISLTSIITARLVVEGMGPGDRIAVISKNTPEYLALFAACESMGLVVVPVNFRLTSSEMAFILRESGSRAVFLHAEALSGVAEELVEALPGVGVWVSWRGKTPDGYQEWNEWLDTANSGFTNWSVDQKSAASIFYTSGTTGKPKGAVLSHQGQVANALVMAAELGLEREDKILLVMPLHHVGGKWLSLSAFARGATLIVESDFDLDVIGHTIHRWGITVTLLAPTMIYRFLKCDGFNVNLLKSLRTILYSSAPMAPALLEEGLNTLGSVFAQAYGSTESGCVTWFSKKEHQEALVSGRYELLASAGKPTVNADVVIMDDQGSELPVGKEGELCVKAPCVFSGYWRNVEATQRTFINGYLRTGDWARRDEEGFVYILDRKDDLIISGGENVYPREVEELLLSHPEVEEAVVVGVPDSEWGERVKAFCVIREGSSLSPQMIMEYCRNKIAGYKRPKEVEIVRELPKNSVGKILRRKLRGTDPRR